MLGLELSQQPKRNLEDKKEVLIGKSRFVSHTSQKLVFNEEIIWFARGPFLPFQLDS